MKDTGPDCFGSWKKNKPGCGKCGYTESCKFSQVNKLKTDSEDRIYKNRKGFRSFIEGLETEGSEAMAPQLIDAIEPQENDDSKYSREDLIKLMQFMMELTEDHWLREVLKEKLRLHNTKTIAEIARDRGVSRQSVDQGVDMALKKVLGFRLKNNNPKLSNQLTPEEYNIYYLRTRKHLNIREIAGRMGYSYGRTQRITKKITGKIGPEWINN
jgi:DNA-directed RNA polymerase specialized sigma subunit